MSMVAQCYGMETLAIGDRSYFKLVSSLWIWVCVTQPECVGVVKQPERYDDDVSGRPLVPLEKPVRLENSTLLAKHFFLNVKKVSQQSESPCTTGQWMLYVCIFHPDDVQCIKRSFTRQKTFTTSLICQVWTRGRPLCTPLLLSPWFHCPWKYRLVYIRGRIRSSLNFFLSHLHLLKGSIRYIRCPTYLV